LQNGKNVKSPLANVCLKSLDSCTTPHKIFNDLPGARSQTGSLSSSSAFRFENLTSMDGNSLSRSSRLHSGVDAAVVDDEHKLIARYVERLTAPANNEPQQMNLDLVNERHCLVVELEAKNREILREIQKLKNQQDCRAWSESGRRDQNNPDLVSELRLLRQHQEELEARMKMLQGSRRGLMQQLEGLMKRLKSSSSPQSSPTCSPRSFGDNSPRVFKPQSSPGLNPADYSLNSLGNDVQHAFNFQSQTTSTNITSGTRGLRQDLLMATDNVTTAMSSLVKELNTDESSGSESETFKQGSIPLLPNFHWKNQQLENDFVQKIQLQQFLNSADDNFNLYDQQNGNIPKTTTVKVDGEVHKRAPFDDNELYDNDPKLSTP
jgi:hypothetical protein